MPAPTANDGLTEELRSLDYLLVLDAVTAQTRDLGLEGRLAAFLDSDDGWLAFRRGCDFNRIPSETAENTLRLGILLYAANFPEAPESFNRVLAPRDVASPRTR